MKKIRYLIIFFLFVTMTAMAQLPNSMLTLPMFGLRDTNVEKSLAEVSAYISGKPKGMLFPVSKVLFTQSEEGLNYQIEGIDNAWSNLFKYGEYSYGYVIVKNRLFVIVGLLKEDIDLNPIFSIVGGSKSFNRANRGPTNIEKHPKWCFSYKDGESTQLNVLDLDTLEK